MDSTEELLMQAREEFPFILDLAVNVITAFTILFLAWIVARILRSKIRKPTFGPDNLDATLRPVIASTVFYVIIAMAIYAFLSKLGVPPTSLLAVFGAAGLAIGLALKDTLSNIASGVMLLVLRPLEIGEYIDTSHYAGTVKEVGLFATTLTNSEGMFVYVPNSEVWRNRLENYSRHSERKFLNNLIQDWGIHSNHMYSGALTAGLSRQNYLKANDDNLIIYASDKLNNALERLTKHREKGDLDLTTVEKAFGYWTSLEGISMSTKDGSSYLYNANNEAINDLTLIVKSESVRIDGKKPKGTRPTSEGLIFWFDMPANSSVNIELK